MQTKLKFTYNGQEIAFEGKGYQSFDNYPDENVVIFVIDNNASSHIDNPKNNYLVIGERQLKVLMVVLVQQEKKISKTNTRFYLRLHSEIYCYVHKTDF